jgi:adenine C2-methylase RlmN of 23S rRNA A2503 and tRNA A37
VCENLKRYKTAAVGFVMPKYIVIPGINDNETDADAFVNLVDELNTPCAIIAYDQNGKFPLADSVVSTIRRLKKLLEDRDILCVPYTVCETYEYVTTLKAAFEE